MINLVNRVLTLLLVVFFLIIVAEAIYYVKTVNKNPPQIATNNIGAVTVSPSPVPKKGPLESKSFEGTIVSVSSVKNSSGKVIDLTLVYNESGKNKYLLHLNEKDLYNFRAVVSNNGVESPIGLDQLSPGDEIRCEVSWIHLTGYTYEVVSGKIIKS